MSIQPELRSVHHIGNVTHITLSIRPKYLVSACLLGICCRYDGKNCANPKVIEFAKTHSVVPICPELFGGLDIPRQSVELTNGRAITRSGADLTSAFERGAQTALALYHSNFCTGAILKSKSPSCGYSRIYDGTFTSTLTSGDGITASLLRLYNVPIYIDTPPEESPNDY